MHNYRNLCVLLGTTAGLALGCSDQFEAPRNACNATGIVTVAGVPTAGVYVYLAEIGNTRAATLGAKTDAQGVFSLSVAAPGEHTVTATWPQVTVDHGEEIEGGDRFRGKYANPGRPILKVTIQEGENTLPPINLKR